MYLHCCGAPAVTIHVPHFTIVKLIRVPTVYMTKLFFQCHFHNLRYTNQWYFLHKNVSPNAWYLLYQQLSIITQCTAHLPNSSFNNYLSWHHDRFPCSRQKVYVFSHSVSGHWTLLLKPLNQWCLHGFKWSKNWWSKKLLSVTLFFDWGFDLILDSRHHNDS